MNNEMSYLLGMICGNGTIQRGKNETTISIEIPHKKQITEDGQDVSLYVRASIADIKNLLDPLVGISMQFTQTKTSTILSLTKNNGDFLIREILRLVGTSISHENIRIHGEIFDYSYDMKVMFLRGFADTTGYIRKSNYFFQKYMHRVYLEIPYNWLLVVDICNLLKSIDIPVQTIDWAHPNMRDGNLTKYNQGYCDFWKKEHQIKIYANEFLPVGFNIAHKERALKKFAEELIINISKIKKETHKFYWESKKVNEKTKQIHPSENDSFIHELIRNKHYNSWKDIAIDLGYKK